MPSKRTIPRVCRTCGNDYMASRDNLGFCSSRCGATKPPPPFELDADGATARIPLLRRDGTIRAYTIVDAADAAWASQWRWFLSNRYVARSVTIDGKQIAIRLHRLLLGLAPGDRIEGDHLNRDRLDNRRSNLRAVTRPGNMQNVPSQSGTSEYRGVYWMKERRKWRATININRKPLHLGLFEDEAEAARVALEARRRLMPYAVD